MKRTLAILITGLTLGALLLWGAERVATGSATAETAGEAPGAASAVPGPVLTLAVPGMTCGSCEGRITRALEKQAGVRSVAVDLRTKLVRVSYDPRLADPKTLADAVTAAGYPARYLPPDAPLPAPAKTGGGCCEKRR